MGIKFKNCSYQMGQRYAKHQMQSGVRVYHQRHYQQAIGRWRAALNRLKNVEDRFITLGYMAQAFCDCSDYESMLHYALQQMELANLRNDDFMKCEAFLNLSKAYERLADFGKAIAYGRGSLQHPSIDARTPGYAHLGIALSYLGLSQFQSSLEEFEKAMGIATETGDKLLELQICVGLGALFTLLKDLNKALIFLQNALAILQLVTVDNVYAKYKSTIFFHLSIVFQKKGALIDAREACDEALRLSFQTANRSIYAHALCSMADINRELGETEAKETITKSWARYEQSFRIMRQINDRMGEVFVLSSMAKSASESRTHYTGQCECQAIQLNKKCLELAKVIGCKHAMMKCHSRLQDLYEQLADEDSKELASKACIALIQEMELFCNFCGQRFGDHDNSLQALRCSHIFHEKCLHEFLLEYDDPTCSKCQRKAVLMNKIVAPPSVLTDEEVQTIFEKSEIDRTQQNENVAEINYQRPPKLDNINRPKSIKQTEIVSSLLPEPYYREMTSPPSIDCSTPKNVAEVSTTVQIPRTISVPIYSPSDATFSHCTNSKHIDDTIPAISSSSLTKILSSPSTMTIHQYPEYTYTGSVPQLSTTVELSSPKNLLATMIAAESSTQQFSLSASTSSVAFYSSGMDNTYHAVTQPAHSSISTQSSSLGSQVPTLLQQTNRRLPSRAERLRSSTLERNSALSTFTTNDILSFSTDLQQQSSTYLQLLKEQKQKNLLLDAANFTNSTRLEQNSISFDSARQSILSPKSNVTDSISLLVNDPVQIEAKPAPPLRKPCCSKDSFPVFSNDLLNSTPSPMIYSTILERAMCPLLEEKEITDDAKIDSLNYNKHNFICNEMETHNKIENENSENRKFIINRSPGVTDV